MRTSFKLVCQTLFSLVFILSFTSCSDEDKEVHQYSYKYIVWKMGEGDGVEEIEHKVDPIVYTNPSTETINISFSEADQVDESSQFYCDNPQLLNMLTETENIQVPLAGSFDSNYKYWDSDITAPLNLNKNILPPLHSATSMLTLPSNSKMIIEGTIKLKKITASYKVVFTDENDENPIEIEGKWVGTFSNGAHIKFIIKDL